MQSVIVKGVTFGNGNFKKAASETAIVVENGLPGAVGIPKGIVLSDNTHHGEPGY